MLQKELNMQQRKLIELIKDYDCTIEYQPRKENVITDALSCKNKATLNKPSVWEEQPLIELR